MILVFPGLSVRRASLAVAPSSRGIGICVQSRLVGLVPQQGKKNHGRTRSSVMGERCNWSKDDARLGSTT